MTNIYAVREKIKNGEDLTQEELVVVTKEIQNTLIELKENKPEEYLALLKEMNQVFGNK